MSSPSLLVGLMPAEAESVFPKPQLAEPRALAPDLRPLDPTGLNAAAFARALAAADPDILLACWNTPAQPAALPPTTFIDVLNTTTRTSCRPSARSRALRSFSTNPSREPNGCAK